MGLVFVVFKQKTAYVMRISDWSSDVCSSDLGVDVLHALDDAAPDGVLAVEEARWRQGDEELAVGRVGVLRARHADDAALERLGREFRRQVGQVGAAAPGAGRIAGLRHEAVDHARSEEHTAELQSIMRISYAGFCL